MKCSLNDYTLEHYDKILASLKETAMYRALLNHVLESGQETDIICNPYLAQAIYKKIIEHHPEIDDETVVHYFNWALVHIREKVSEEREKSRAKRLSLHPSFDAWSKASARINL